MRAFFIALLVLAVLAWLALALIGWPASAYRDNDFASLWIMGRMLLTGGDQYDYASYVEAHRAIGSRALTIVLPDTASFYPLTTALIAVPYALLPLALAAPAWLVTQAAFAIAALVMLARRLVPATFRRDAFVLVGLTAATQSAWLMAGGGNLGGFILGLAASATTLLLAGHPALAGVAAGAILIVKPQPLLIAMFAVLLAVQRRDAIRMTAAALGVAVVALALTIALRPGWIGEFLAQTPRVAAYASRTRQSTVFGLLGPELAWLAWLIVVAAVAALVLWVVRARPPLPLVAGASVAVSLFCAPYGWSYDHLTLAITAAAVIALVAPFERARLAALLALTVAFVIVPWTTYALAFQRGEESLSALVPAAMFAVVMGTAQRVGALRSGARA